LVDSRFRGNDMLENYFNREENFYGI